LLFRNQLIIWSSVCQFSFEHIEFVSALILHSGKLFLLSFPPDLVQVGQQGIHKFWRHLRAVLFPKRVPSFVGLIRHPAVFLHCRSSHITSTVIYIPRKVFKFFCFPKHAHQVPIVLLKLLNFYHIATRRCASILEHFIKLRGFLIQILLCCLKTANSDG
jgi:hypothetical protein